ncbi:uncharacterized protein LOC117569194 [Drosophila albomicans]|uniref:Uncharacterized protein LOC117569194 n=1 Tax=Drosophila albomicans TaxID=7291 RepID=A0A6P8X343_DROAB|nr:uncharacterized protein LOC117569194 [Drosophila albomicans]
MRLALLALIGVLCLAYCYAVDPEYEQIGLLDVDASGVSHENVGEREARQWGGYGRGGGWGGRGGWGGGGWGGRGGYGGGGWGGRGGYGGGGWGGRGYGWGR